MASSSESVIVRDPEIHIANRFFAAHAYLSARCLTTWRAEKRWTNFWNNIPTLVVNKPSLRWKRPKHLFWHVLENANPD